MVNGIPIFEVRFGQELLNNTTSSGRVYGYCIEADRGPVGEPVFVSSNTEAKKIFGVNFAPHFYQNGGGLYICRVPFLEAKAPSITYKAKTSDSGSDTIDVIKVSGATPGIAPHEVSIIKTPTSTKSYNLTVSINGVGSKKYQGLPSLQKVVDTINSKFADYIVAELLIDEDMALTTEATKTLVKTESGEWTYRNNTGEENTVQSTDVVYSVGAFSNNRLQANLNTDGTVNNKLEGGSLGKLRTTKGEVSTVEIPSTGFTQPISGTGTGENQANVDVTLQYAYNAAFEIMEDVDIIGIATLSNSKIVQNELVEHIEKMVDPEVYKYRFGITGFLEYNDVDSHGNKNATAPISTSNLTEATAHIDNPFVIVIGQGVVFEEDGERYNLLPHEAVQLYTGLRSALNYGQAIFGGNSRKVLSGVKNVLPVITDGEIITRSTIEMINEAGLTTFKKEYGEITFLEGVTSIQDNPVLSHESIMSIVLNTLKRLVAVAKPFQGENVTEDLKVSLINALSAELQTIVESDGTLVALEDYNIPPYAVDVQSTIMAGFNEAGEYVRESHYLVTVKIVPIGALRSITLSVVVI